MDQTERQRLLEMIRRLSATDGEEAELDKIADHLKFRFPGILDLIFWSKEPLAAEEILDRAIELRRPIPLPPPDHLPFGEEATTSGPTQGGIEGALARPRRSVGRRATPKGRGK